MKLIRLTLENFMPYKGQTVLDFPQDAAKNTLIVQGDNMRGKTSLLNGIRWALYDKAQGRHLRSIPLHLMLNSEAASEGNWNMSAQIEFEANGSIYDLRRVATKKNTVARPARPEDFQVFAYLKKDGAAIPANEIEGELNKFAPEQVSRFFLFDGELLQEYEELLIEGSDQGKKIKEAIEQALGVPALTNGREDLQVLLKRAQKEQAKEASTIKGLEVAAENFKKWESRRDALEIDRAVMKDKLVKVKEERQALEDEITAFESVLNQKAELDAKRARSKEIDEHLKEKQAHKLEIVGRAWRDLLRPKILAKKEALQQLQSEATQHSKNKALLELKIEQANKHLTDSICSACGQKIENHDKEEHQKRLRDFQSELQSLASSHFDLEAINIELKLLDSLLGNPVKERLFDLDEDMTRLEVEQAKLGTRIEQLQDELNGNGSDELLRKRARFQHALKDETRYQQQIDDIDKKHAEAHREAQLQMQRMNAQGGRNVTRASQIAKVLEQMHEAFAVSIDHLRTSLKQTVEFNATKAFLRMSTQKAYKGLSINENYGLTIVGEDGVEVPLRSAGAEQIVALSLIDGLSRSGRSAGPVVMDTPFGRLDTKHRKNILSYLPDSASQLVLLVHDGEIMNGDGLNALAHRIGARYEIKEISQNHSVLERIS